MTKHPAPFTHALLPHLASMIVPADNILDPFAGIGRAHLLKELLPSWVNITCVELEPEWARQCNRGVVGNALRLPFPDQYFDGVVTSPCYGNRMADHHEAKDGSARNTYRHKLGRPLHPDNAGQLQWGYAYKNFHRLVWAEVRRVLAVGGVFVLNVKDHVRGGQRVLVCEWHKLCLQTSGFLLTDTLQVPVHGNGFGANGKLRVPYEIIYRFVRVS